MEDKTVSNVLAYVLSEFFTFCIIVSYTMKLIELIHQCISYMELNKN